jgi:uracil-DNA glycosylase family 4
MESVDYHSAAAMLAWQIELGADESICDQPLNRYELPAALAKPAKAVVANDPKARPTPPPVYEVPKIDGAAIARDLAAQAGDLAALEQAVAGFEHCELKRGARNMLFGQGVAGASVMVIGDAPNRDDDRAGVFLDGARGLLFDKMFAAIGLSRTGEAPAVYYSHIMPWRPPQDRDPKANELAMMKPFIERQIALVNPDVLILMGNIACQCMMGKRGMTRLRGDWVEVMGKPTLPMFHPSQLMRTPIAKRDAWADLLSVKSRIQG